MQCSFDPIKHRYYINGQRVPTVTEILNHRYPISPFVSQGDLRRASKYGHDVHKMVDLFNRGTLNEDKLSPALVPVLDQWKEFLSDFKIRITVSEQKVFSELWGYGGCLDNIGLKLDTKKNVLVDLKTGIYHCKFELQTSAYMNAYFIRPIDVLRTERWCLTLGSGPYSLKVHDDKNDFQNFIGLLNNYKRDIRKGLIKWEK